MQPLSAAELLDVWEWGLGRGTVERALGLLASACPELPAEALARWSIGRRDGLLLTLREWAFGSQLASVADCPQCGERLELSFAIDDIRIPTGADSACDESFGCSVGEYNLCLRLPTSRDLAALTTHHDVTSKRRALFERCVMSVQREGSNVASEELPEDVIAVAVASMAEADPQAHVQLALTCPLCAHHWQATFDIVSFFWQEIGDWAQGTLGAIHTLASAYGWREADILALSPQRRQIYLEMVRGEG